MVSDFSIKTRNDKYFLNPETAFVWLAKLWRKSICTHSGHQELHYQCTFPSGNLWGSAPPKWGYRSVQDMEYKKGMIQHQKEAWRSEGGDETLSRINLLRRRLSGPSAGRMKVARKNAMVLGQWITIVNNGTEVYQHGNRAGRAQVPFRRPLLLSLSHRRRWWLCPWGGVADTKQSSPYTHRHETQVILIVCLLRSDRPFPSSSLILG